MTSAITILPESDDRTLCVQVSGVISAHMFDNFFIQPALSIIRQHGTYNLCAIYSDYRGWDADAADISFKYYSKIGKEARNLAYVNPPDSRHLLLKMMTPIMPDAKIRFFEMDEKEAALAWAKSRDPKG